MHHIFYEIFKAIGHIHNPIFLEIGANKTEDSQKIISFLDDPIYYAFEPNPDNISYIKSHKLDKNLHLIEAAVSDEEGTKELYKSSGNIDPKGESWSGSSSILPPKNHLQTFPWCKFEGKTDVHTVTLDDFCNKRDIKQIHFMWVDVQGGEHLVIKGGQKALKMCNYLYCEYSNDELYEGQLKLEEWMDLLPCKFEILEKYPHDVLLRQL